MLVIGRIFFGILAIPILLTGILGGYIFLEMAWRKAGWVAVEAKVVQNAPGCIVTFMPKGSLAFQDGAVVPCNAALDSIKLPDGAQRPRIKKGSIGRLEYVSGGRAIVKEGWLDSLIGNAVAGETIRLMHDPADSTRLEYGGKLNGLFSGLAIIVGCFGVFGLYVYFLWILPRAASQQRHVIVPAHRMQSPTAPRTGFGRRN